MKKLKILIDNNFLLISLLVSALATAALVIWSEKYHGKAVLFEVLKNNRSAVYGALATIFGSLLGFVITAVSVVVGFTASDRLTIVRESKHYPALWASFTHTIKVLGLATLTSLAALIVDRDNNPQCYMAYINCFTSILAVLLLCRSIWALENIVAIVAKPAKGLRVIRPSEEVSPFHPSSADGGGAS